MLIYPLISMQGYKLTHIILESPDNMHKAAMPHKNGMGINKSLPT